MKKSLSVVLLLCMLIGIFGKTFAFKDVKAEIPTSMPIKIAVSDSVKAALRVTSDDAGNPCSVRAKYGGSIWVTLSETAEKYHNPSTGKDDTVYASTSNYDPSLLGEIRFYTLKDTVGVSKVTLSRNTSSYPAGTNYIMVPDSDSDILSGSDSTFSWQPPTYKVTYASNGGTGEMSGQVFVAGVSQSLSENIFTRMGYTFTGWNESSTATTADYDDKAETTISSDITLYAVWQPDAKPIANCTVDTVAAQAYTGSEIKPTLTVKDGEKTLVLNTDYTVEYSDNINAGTATVTITGIGDYGGTKTVNFTISAKSLADYTIETISNQTYIGSEIKPSLTVKYGSETLNSATDYTVAYTNNVNAGTATATITGKGNFTGTKSKNFTIVAKALSITGTTADAKEYNGTVAATAHKGNVSGIIGSDDVSVEIASATFADANVGNGKTVTISYTLTGTKAGNYTLGNSTTIADISAKSVENCTVEAIDDQAYTGEEIKPTVTVKDGEKTLALNTDYTVEYSENTDAGTATVTVTGIGNYTGTKDKDFTITEKSVADFTVEGIVNQIYTGEEIKPTVTVKDGEKVLTVDTDYTVEYSDNINAGTATVTITGIGNYTDSKDVTFAIVKLKDVITVTGLENFVEKTATGNAIITVGENTDLHVEDLKAIYVDGKALVEGVDYITEEGCIKITLYKSYLSSLSAGNHNLTIALNNDLEYTTDFTVTAAPQKSPATDDSATVIWLALASSIIAMGVLLTRKRKADR